MKWTGPRWRAVMLDVLERAGWSAGQVFVATLIAGGATTAVAGLPWRYAATLGLSAAFVSILGTFVQYSIKKADVGFWADLAVRLAKTFAGSLLGSAMAGEVFDIVTFDWATALNVAFVATLAALGKGLLAREPAADTPGETRTSPSSLPTSVHNTAVGRR